VHTDRFDDPNLPGVMKVTVNLKKVSVGTELDIVQEGIPEVIPVEACYLGWQESLQLLMLLVEAEVPAPANVRAVLKRACYDCHSNDASLVLPGGPPGRGPFGRGPRAAARVGHEDAA